MLLFHDNVQLHIAKQTVKRLAALKCEVFSYPPYSFDLSSADYYFV